MEPRDKDCGQPLEGGRGKETCYHVEPPKECSPADSLILALGDPFKPSDLPNYKTVNLCCF